MRSAAPWSISGIPHRPETLAFCSVRSSQSRLCRPLQYRWPRYRSVSALPAWYGSCSITSLVISKPLFKYPARCTAVLTPPFAAVPTNVEKANRE